jgi:hypothetical protein
MEATEPKRRGGHFFLVLVLGIALGAASTILLVQWAAPYLVESLQGGGLVEGQVLDKAPELDRLLLKITTEHGVFLATFTQKQKEIDLLVEQGDTITLDVPEYEPFLEDPTIKRVRRPELPIEPKHLPPEAEIQEEPLVDEPEETIPPAEPAEGETPPS